NANCASPFIKCTRFGNFNLRPLPGEQIIPRNFGQAPGAFTLNLRIPRNFGFAEPNGVAAARQRAAQSTAAAGNAKRGGAAGAPGGPRGPMIPGGGGGGGGEGRGPGGGGGGGMGGFGGRASSEKK